MRVLAIDTALEACAAAVLDTEHGVLASESLPMVRGHAEALMPLIARVMAQADMPFAALDRIAVTTGPGSFTGLRVGISAARGIALAAGKPAFGLTTLAAFAAPYIAHDDKIAVAVAIDARHQHVYLQMFGPGGRTLVAPRIASVARRGARSPPTARCASSAPARDMLAAAWPAREPPPALVEDRRAPDIVWVGAARAPPPTTAPARPSRSICARPTRSRRTPRGCRADDRDDHAPVRARRAGAVGGEPARRRARSPRCTPPRSGAAGATASSSGCCSSATSSPIAPRRGRALHGFILSRLAAGEAEILSVAVASARRGRGLARALLNLHLRRLAGLGARAVFLEVDEDNAPARRLYQRAGFREVGRRPGYYQQGRDQAATALVLRRDLV